MNFYRFVSASFLGMATLPSHYVMGEVGTVFLVSGGIYALLQVIRPT